MTALDDALLRPALTVDGRDYSVAEVVAAALYLSEWSGVEHRARAAAAATVHPAAGEVPQEEVREAAAAFRRERRLLSAEEMEAWLAQRGLSAGGWMRWVRSDLARRRFANGGDVADPDPDAEPDPEPDAVAADALWAEALCSGALARAAHRLAELLVAPEPAEKPSPPRRNGGPVDPEPLRALGVDPAQALAILASLPVRESALELFAERAATPAAVEERVRARQTDWLAVDFRALAVPRETIAREALLCVRDDGMALEEVAQVAQAELSSERALLADAPAGLQEHLLSASAGELIGPVERDGQVQLLIVDAKERPSADDPEVGRRARDELLGRLLDREIATRVHWHDRL